VTVPKQTSPLMKGSIYLFAHNDCIFTSSCFSNPCKHLRPSVTHTVSVPVHSLMTSLKPKAMADVTVASKSLYKVPSTASTLLVNPTISDMCIASKASTENKYIMHTDSFPVSSIAKKPQKSITSTDFPLRTLVLPLNATLINTSEIREDPDNSHAELKTDPVAQISGTFIS